MAPEEATRLAHLAKTDEDARERLIQAHKYLVIDAARMVHTTRRTFAQRVEHGTVALSEAVHAYGTTSRANFANFAGARVRTFLRDLVSDLDANDDDFSWISHAPELDRYRDAMSVVAYVLAPEHPAHTWFMMAIREEPVPIDLPPAVDAASVDLSKLSGALERLWAAYRELPSRPTLESYSKYIGLPARERAWHRGILDQSLRVLVRRVPLENRDLETALWKQIIGDVSRLPGMEDLERYSEVLVSAGARREA